MVKKLKNPSDEKRYKSGYLLICLSHWLPVIALGLDLGGGEFGFVPASQCRQPCS